MSGLAASRSRPLSLKEAELAIVGAPFEDGGWERAILAMADATRSTAAQLIGMGGPALLPLNIFVGAPSSFTHYIRSAYLHGPINWRIGAVGAPMSIQHEAHYSHYRSAIDTSDYDDAAAEMDIPFGCQSPIVIDGRNFLGVALLRGRREGPCTPDTLEAFARMRQLVARAIEVRISLDADRAWAMLDGSAGENQVTFLLDRFGSVCAASDEAIALIGPGGLFLPGEIALTLHDPGDDRRFRSALARLYSVDLTSGASLVATLRLGMASPAPMGQWRMVMARLPVDPGELGFGPVVALSLTRL